MRKSDALLENLADAASSSWMIMRMILNHLMLSPFISATPALPCISPVLLVLCFANEVACCISLLPTMESPFDSTECIIMSCDPMGFRSSLCTRWYLGQMKTMKLNAPCNGMKTHVRKTSRKIPGEPNLSCVSIVRSTIVNAIGQMDVFPKANPYRMHCCVICLNRSCCSFDVMDDRFRFLFRRAAISSALSATVIVMDLLTTGSLSVAYRALAVYVE
mmetsp:Transcript_2768/g.7695  ORF Transcript_2768/g.7695 Transcript_2768/m.7695 type:complete len:218 (+) Transcript_2768:432-1085(+)